MALLLVSHSTLQICIALLFTQSQSHSSHSIQLTSSNFFPTSSAAAPGSGW